jgi:hypothetical protein
MQPCKGALSSKAEELKKSAVNNAQISRGKLSEQLGQVDQGKPLHTLAAIYTAANLRLPPPANEKYQMLIVETAPRHGHAP